MLIKWPCCLSTYVSDCHSHKSNCPRPSQAKTIQSPLLLKEHDVIGCSEILKNESN